MSDGYVDYSMSVRAAMAYEAGEMPSSKWTKKALVTAIEKGRHNYEEEEGVIIRDDVLAELKRMRADDLRNFVLLETAEHHTSKYYRLTSFFRIDFDKIAESSVDGIRSFVAERKKEREKRKEDAEMVERWECKYLEWSGTRKYPKSWVETATGYIQGQWFHLDKGGRKLITANGFEKIRRLD